MNRSPFFYVGDKYKLMPQLVNIFPKEINRLVEPFCGGGSVFLNTVANNYLANDNNEWMIKLHRFLVKEAKNRERFFKKIFALIKEYGLSASYLGILAPDDLKKKYVKTYYARYNKEAYSAIMPMKEFRELNMFMNEVNKDTMKIEKGMNCHPELFYDPNFGANDGFTDEEM